MLKYVDTKVTFSEIPDHITLCINLSNCPNNCEGCHSSYLSEDVGEILVFSRIERLIKANRGITAVCFMGGDNDPKLINHYSSLVKDKFYWIKVGWYSGKQEVAKKIDLHNFDYIKLGPYIKELGPLTSKTTNQKFYEVTQLSGGKCKLIDRTYKFWRNND